MRRKLEKLSLADVKSELELQRIVDYPWNTILPKDVVKRVKKN